MEDSCCEIPHRRQVGSEIQSPEDLLCPQCRKKGRAVELVTLRHQIKPPSNLSVADGSYLFCRTSTCPVVYFSNKGNRVFEKKDVRYPVGLKETKGPHDVCYCFGFTEEMIRGEVEKFGKTGIPLKIAAEVKAGNCACEVKNPQGHCCLGNVQEIIQTAQKQKKVIK